MTRALPSMKVQCFCEATGAALPEILLSKSWAAIYTAGIFFKGPQIEDGSCQLLYAGWFNSTGHQWLALVPLHDPFALWLTSTMSQRSCQCWVFSGQCMVQDESARLNLAARGMQENATGLGSQLRRAPSSQSPCGRHDHRQPQAYDVNKVTKMLPVRRTACM